MPNRETEWPMPITIAEQLDNAFATALSRPYDTPWERYLRMVSVTNVNAFYRALGTFPPPMDAIQRSVFEECHRDAVLYGLERDDEQM